MNENHIELKNKTIETIRKFDAKIKFDKKGNSYTEPAYVEITFTDNTKCRIIASQEGDVYSGESPYIDLKICY
jgi:hypothetical protein